jgi:transposase-like protein
MTHPLALAKAEAIRLRVEERRSIGEIAARVKAARSTVSLWLRPYPLTNEER